MATTGKQSDVAHVSVRDMSAEHLGLPLLTVEQWEFVNAAIAHDRTKVERRGVLQRNTDVSGVSDTGTVARIIVMQSGTAILYGWKCGGVEWFPTVDAAMCCHGHDGATVIVWDA